jgi:hypothetical protein
VGFQIFQNNNFVQLTIYYQRGALDCENFIFPKYLIGISMKKIYFVYLTGMNDSLHCYSEEDPIDFPEN